MIVSPAACDRRPAAYSLDTRRTEWCEMPTATQIAVAQMTMNDARGQALFCSGLQLPEAPTADMAAMAISRAVQQFGIRGCVCRMAQEFGDHPDTAARRMRWARHLIDQQPSDRRRDMNETSDGCGTWGPGRSPRAAARVVVFADRSP
jgi:hypothetical protein